MDRHDTASAVSRDDRETRILGKSRNARNRVFYTTHKGGRICDEKVGLRSLLRGDKTWVSIAQAKGKLPALSRKANAKKEKE